MVSSDEIEELMQRLAQVEALLEQPKPVFVDVYAVARALGVSSRTVWNWTRSGLLKCYRLGNVTRWDWVEVEATFRTGIVHPREKLENEHE